MAAGDEREPPAVGRPGPADPSAARAGLRMSDLLLLPDEWRAMLKWMIREGEASLAGIAAGLGWDQSTALALLERLVAAGYVQRTGEGEDTRYRVILARQRAQGASRGLLRNLEDTSGD